MMPAVLTVCVIVMMYLHVGLCGDACCVLTEPVGLLQHTIICMWDCVMMPAEC